MAVKMRLRREGKKKQPFYRVVVADARSPRDGRFIEDLGYYQPTHDPSTISIKRDRALYWLRNGAQPTDAVVNLLRIEGVWEEFRPGDTGRVRPARQEAERKAAEKRAGGGAPQGGGGAPEPQRAEAPAAETPASPAEGAPAAAVEQAREEDTQPDAGAPEDAAALEEGTAE